MELITRKDARSLGLKRYKTENLCPQGHDSDRFVSTGRCYRCTNPILIYEIRNCEVCAEPMEVSTTSIQKRCSKKCRGVGAARQYRRERVDRYREIAQKYRDSGKGKASKSKRRAMKVNACVSWADQSAIDAMYAEAARLTSETGIRHAVDHIVPLIHPRVCGLHVEGNLQVITAAENSRKSNRFKTDFE